MKDLESDLESILEAELMWLQVEYAKLQRASTLHLEELIDAGLSVFNTDKAVDIIFGMLEDTGIRKELQEVECEVMKKPMVEVRELIRKGMCMMHKRGPPVSVVHGDIIQRNFVRSHSKEKQLVLLDWGRAHIDIAFQGLPFLKDLL